MTELSTINAQEIAWLASLGSSDLEEYDDLVEVVDDALAVELDDVAEAADRTAAGLRMNATYGFAATSLSERLSALDDDERDELLGLLRAA